MKKNNAPAIIMIALIFAMQLMSAQGALELFGFYQGQLLKQKGDMSIVAPLPIGPGGSTVPVTLNESHPDFTGSNIQQLNLFLRKELSGSLTSWINIQFINNYSSHSTSGSNIEYGKMSLEEAWLKWDYSTALSVKAGYLIPRFNYLNEIQNRMPLLPYVTRPLVYEGSLGGTINIPAFVPQKAFLQASGYIPLGVITGEYSAFVGQSDVNYQTEGVGGSMDSVNFKAFGGRIGAKTGDFHVGVSATFDRDKTPALNEDVPRTRIGADFGFTFMNFFGDAEYISVALDPVKPSKDLNKSFYYANLGYNIIEEAYVFATVSNLKDKEVDYLEKGINGVTFGGGVRPSESVVVKMEYSNYSTKDGILPIQFPAGPGVVLPVKAVVNLDYTQYTIGMSVIF